MAATSLDQLLLPFAEKEYVDTMRAARILGVSLTTVYALYEAGEIEMIGYAERKRKRVRYQSLVDLCDRLRLKYAIADRRPALSAAYLRHHDRDLLPFPLDDTLSIEEARVILGYESAKPISIMIEEGRFEAYQLTHHSPWRISRASLGAFLQSAHRNARMAAKTHQGSCTEKEN